MIAPIKTDASSQTVTESELFINQNCNYLARLPLEIYGHICSFLRLQSLERLSRISRQLNFIVRPKLLLLNQFQTILGVPNRSVVSSLVLNGKYEDDFLYYKYHVDLDAIHRLAIIIKHKKFSDFRNHCFNRVLIHTKPLNRHSFGTSTHDEKKLQTDLYTGIHKIISHNEIQQNTLPNIISHNVLFLEHPDIFLLFKQFLPDPICKHQFATHIQAIYRGFRVRQSLLRLRNQQNAGCCTIS
ncbi:MAG: hypothetical protein VW397_06775 [Candidatus Margulisiibacteriota bacterium]